MKFTLSIILSLCLCFNKCEAVTQTSPSMGFNDVFNTLLLCNPGDTLAVPAGIAHWANTLSVSNAINIVFAGVSNSVIIDDLTNTSGYTPSYLGGLIVFWNPTNTIASASGFTISNNAGWLGPNNHILTTGAIQCLSNGIVHLFNFQTQNIYNNHVFISGGCTGLEDHFTNYVSSPAHGICLNQNYYGNINFGEGWYHQPINFGSSNKWYAENFAMINPSNTANCSGFDTIPSGAVVLRYGYFHDVYVDAHGAESGGANSGFRGGEFYDLIFDWDLTEVNDFNFRGGVTLVYSCTNTGTEPNAFAVLNKYNTTDHYPKWGDSCGSNPLDLNRQPQVAAATNTATATGTSSSLSFTCSTASWTVNQWIGYSISNTSTTATSPQMNYSIINSNDATHAYFLSSQIAQNMIITNGNIVTFWKITNCLEMPGVGEYTGLVMNASGVATNNWDTLNPTIEPSYSCSNSFYNGSSYTDVGYYPVCPIILSGIHFSNDTMPAGYVPLTYPHPLEGTLTAPIITVQPPASQTLSLGSAFLTSVTATGNPSPTYQWSINGSTITGATLSSFSVGSIVSSNAGTYTVNVANSQGNVTSANSVLVIGSGSAPTITTQSLTQTVPLGNTANLNVGVSGSAPFSYAWYFNGSIYQGYNSSSISIPNSTLANSGSYDVVVTNTYGAVTSSVAVLTVMPYIYLTGGTGVTFTGGTNLILTGP